jgi:hypothetical protein
MGEGVQRDSTEANRAALSIQRHPPSDSTHANETNERQIHRNPRQIPRIPYGFHTTVRVQIRRRATPAEPAPAQKPARSRIEANCAMKQPCPPSSFSTGYEEKTREN